MHIKILIQLWKLHYNRFQWLNRGSAEGITWAFRRGRSTPEEPPHRIHFATLLHILLLLKFRKGEGRTCIIVGPDSREQQRKHFNISQIKRPDKSLVDLSCQYLWTTTKPLPSLLPVRLCFTGSFSPALGAKALPCRVAIITACILAEKLCLSDSDPSLLLRRHTSALFYSHLVT